MGSEPRTHCANCDTHLIGEYCSECGQPARDYDVPIGTFAKDVVSESFDLDSRLRATMGPLFFQPGRVPRDYVAGHRARFVPPIRLYILASFVMFLLMSFGSGVRVDSTRVEQREVEMTGGRGGAAVGASDTTAESGETTAESGDSNAEAGDATAQAPAADPGDQGELATDAPRTGVTELGERIDTRISEGLERAGDDRRGFAEDFSSRMAQAMFLLLPLFALLLKGLYPRRLYVHHLVFAIYLHSWVFLIVAVTMLPEVLGFPLVSAVLSVILLWAPVYLFLAMRRFYEESRIRTFLKVLVLSNVYVLLASVTMLGVVYLTVTTT